eukprot:SAG31_NODE_5174_length_2700_cov_2.550942_3_plen_160_part_00
MTSSPHRRRVRLPNPEVVAVAGPRSQPCTAHSAVLCCCCSLGLAPCAFVDSSSALFFTHSAGASLLRQNRDARTGCGTWPGYRAWTGWQSPCSGEGDHHHQKTRRHVGHSGPRPSQPHRASKPARWTATIHVAPRPLCWGRSYQEHRFCTEIFTASWTK